MKRGLPSEESKSFTEPPAPIVVKRKSSSALNQRTVGHEQIELTVAVVVCPGDRDRYPRI